MPARPATIEAIGPSYPVPDRKTSSLRAVNWFVRQVEGYGEGKQVVLESVPGMEEVADLGETIRGSYTTESRWFVAAGSSLYDLSSLSPANLGSLSTITGFVGMAHGTSQLVAVDGPNGYVYDLSAGTFAAITDPDFRGSKDVAVVNGTFLFVAPDSDQPYSSEVDDATSYDALDFTSADTQPDNIVGHCVLKQEALFFGVNSTEVWIYEATGSFPFVRYNSTPINVGIVGPRAHVEAADTRFFVGKTKNGQGVVYMLQGHQPVPISDAAVEAALQAADLSTCSMWSFQMNGVEFIGINADGMETTWVYNARTRLWHEQGMLVDGEWTPFPISFIAAFNGEVYAMSGTKVYRLDRDLFEVDGTPIVRERTWPHLVSPSLEPISYECLELSCSTGNGGSMTLEVSNDGGYTFGPPLQRSLGATGRYNYRVRWFPLGTANDRVFRLRCSDAVRLTLHNAALEAA